MKKFSYYVNHLEEYLLMVLMAVMATVVFIQVVFRVMKGSLPWSEEFSRYLTVWITFIGASYGVKKGAHIGVEAFTLLLPIKARKAVNLLAIAACMFFCVIVCYYGYEVCLKQFSLGQLSPAMQIPMWWAYCAIPVGMVMMTLRYIQSAVGIIRNFSGNTENVTEEGKEVLL